MNLLRWGGRRVIVELQGLCIERSRHTLHSPGFPSVLALANFRVTVHPPHLPCGAGESISFLHRQLEKKELEVTKA